MHLPPRVRTGHTSRQQLHGKPPPDHARNSNTALGASTNSHIEKHPIFPWKPCVQTANRKCRCTLQAGTFLCLRHFFLDRARGLKVVSSASLLAFKFVHPVAVMLECLALLLFKECSVLLNPWEIERWAAATETVLWSLLYQQKSEESEIDLPYCEMVEEGWFSDRLQGHWLVCSMCSCDPR